MYEILLPVPFEYKITKTYLLIYNPLDFKQYSIHKIIISIIIIVQFKVNLNNLMFNFNNY